MWEGEVILFPICNFLQPSAWVLQGNVVNTLNNLKLPLPLTFLLSLFLSHPLTSSPSLASISLSCFISDGGSNANTNLQKQTFKNKSITREAGRVQYARGSVLDRSSLFLKGTFNYRCEQSLPSDGIIEQNKSDLANSIISPVFYILFLNVDFVFILISKVIHFNSVR